MNQLPVIQKTYDLIKWYIPILTRLPKIHKFGLGDRMTSILYDLLESLITARYSANKLQILEPLNAKIDILRHLTRLMSDLTLIENPRYEYASQHIDQIGMEIGGWLKQVKIKNL